jgi:hypothetical protein
MVCFSHLTTAFKLRMNRGWPFSFLDISEDLWYQATLKVAKILLTVLLPKLLWKSTANTFAMNKKISKEELVVGSWDDKAHVNIPQN